MSENPLVTVIVNTYNQVKYWRTLIEGLESQTYDNFQVWFMDDGSTDGTSETISKYCGESVKSQQFASNNAFKYRYYLPSFNSGFFGCLKDGIACLSAGTDVGKYWKILEGDDYYYPDQIEKQVKFLEEHPDYIGVHSDTDYLTPDGNLETFHWRKTGRYDFSGHHFDYIPQGLIFNDLVKSNFIMTCSFTAKAEAWQQFYRFDDFKERGYKMGDWSTYLGMSRYNKIGYIDESLAVYRSGFGVSNNPEKRQAFVESSLQIQRDALIGRL